MAGHTVNFRRQSVLEGQLLIEANSQQHAEQLAQRFLARADLDPRLDYDEADLPPNILRVRSRTEPSTEHYSIEDRV